MMMITKNGDILGEEKLVMERNNKQQKTEAKNMVKDLLQTNATNLLVVPITLMDIELFLKIAVLATLVIYNVCRIVKFNKEKKSK